MHVLLTSEERVLEGEGVEDTETETRADSETALVLVEADIVDFLAGFVSGCAYHKSRRIDYCSHYF